MNVQNRRTSTKTMIDLASISGVVSARKYSSGHMGVKLVPYSLFLIRKGIKNEKYVSFFIPYLIMNKE